MAYIQLARLRHTGSAPKANFVGHKWNNLYKSDKHGSQIDAASSSDLSGPPGRIWNVVVSVIHPSPGNSIKLYLRARADWSIFRSFHWNWSKTSLYNVYTYACSHEAYIIPAVQIKLFILFCSFMQALIHLLIPPPNSIQDLDLINSQ